ERRNEQREDALVEIGEELDAEERADAAEDHHRDRLADDTADPAPPRDHEERVRGQQRKADDHHSGPRPEHAGEDRRGDQRQSPPREALRRAGHGEADGDRYEVERTDEVVPMSSPQSTA